MQLLEIRQKITTTVYTYREMAKYTSLAFNSRSDRRERFLTLASVSLVSSKIDKPENKSLAAGAAFSNGNYKALRGATERSYL